MANENAGVVKNGGAGYHVPWVEANHLSELTKFGQYLFAISMIYFTGVNLPKLAILVLYKRLFPNKGLHLVINVIIGAIVLYIAITFLIILLACRPIAANWDMMIPGAHCIDKEAFFIYGSVLNMVTDLVILALPLRIVWNLHAGTRLKFELTVTFAVGSL